MNLENMSYFCFGNNLVIGKHIRKQLDFLQDILPRELRYREMDDLGCGDGKVTVLLKEILQPVKLRGFDVSQNLVRRAISRGIDAGNINLDDYVPQGELAVVWGVLHHLKDPGNCIAKLKDNYPFIFIREPIRTSIIKGFELGNPMRQKELTGMLHHHLPTCQIHYCDDNVLAFYGCKSVSEKEKVSVFRPATALVPELNEY